MFFSTKIKLPLPLSPGNTLVCYLFLSSNGFSERKCFGSSSAIISGNIRLLLLSRPFNSGFLIINKESPPRYYMWLSVYFESHGRKGGSGDSIIVSRLMVCLLCICHYFAFDRGPSSPWVVKNSDSRVIYPWEEPCIIF